MAKVLVVDDEEKICFAFEQFLLDEGHTPLIAATAEEALKIIENDSPQIVFLDIRLPGESGLALLEKINLQRLSMMVVIMTAHGTMDTAIEAMRRGAYEYVTKPIDLDRIGEMIDRMLRSRTVSTIEHHDLPTLKDGLGEDVLLIGKSPAIQDIYKMIGLLTTNDVPVLIEGESGVGKELVARAIHYKSDRRDKPFVAINCGAMPDNLLETELFGHERGAFTGADTRKFGKFEHAADGTIFLDEIGELQLPLQVKLLRAIQEKHIVRVGGLDTIPIRARLITATNKNLAEEMAAGNFRSDLYYRLQLITLRIPPLRERKEDIPDLVAYFIRKANAELGKSICGIETDAMDKMISYDWPGNVRELENMIKRAAILTRGDTLGLHRFETPMTGVSNSWRGEAQSAVEKTVQRWFQARNTAPFFSAGRLHRNLISTIEKTLIQEALLACDNNQVKASELLGMNRATFRKKMEEYGFKP